MPGLMQRQPLLISSIIRYAARQHPQTEVVSHPAPGRVHRTTYATLERRARQAMRVLRRLGLLPGDRVATLALPGFRHLELAYAATGMGAVFQALDPRLPDDDLAALLDQGDDCVLCVDAAFADLAATLVPRVRHAVRRLVVLCDEIELPMVYLPVAVSLHCYEALLACDAPEDDWPVFAEDVTAVLAATAGATGPRRVVQRTQRDIVLATLTANQPDGLGLRATDRVVACAEMHQFCGWSLPFAAPMAGAALLLPGWPADGAVLAGLIAAERATCLVALPAVLAGLHRHLTAPCDPAQAAAGPALADRLAGVVPSLRRVVLSGAAAPPPLLAAFAGTAVSVTQGWGLTEAGGGLTTTAPIAGEACAALPRGASQGRALFGVDMRLLDSGGEELPWDGLAIGELQVRGPAVSQRYLDGGEGRADGDFWLATGDIASIDPNGFVTVLDRVSDLIRSGGQWISSTRLEAAALGHADVAEAACVAARHPKWTERPVLLVVAWPGGTLDPHSVLARLRADLPRWSWPDAVVTLPALPRTPSGRIDKRALRRQFADHLGGGRAGQMSPLP